MQKEVEVAEHPNDPAAQPSRTGARPSRELDLFELLLLLRRRVWAILACGVAGLVLTAIVLMFIKPLFSSTGVLLMPQNNPSASSFAVQMAIGNLDLMGGGFELYVDVMRSRTVAERLVDQYNLKQVYEMPDEGGAEHILALRTSIDSAKEGLIRVTVRDTDPKRAADLANAYMRELDRLNQGLAIGSAGQQRVYFEREMIKEKNALADAEVALKQTQEQTGILVPESQAQAQMSAIETTRAQIRVREVQLGALLQGATEQNPEVVRLRSEITGLEGQLQAMQAGSGSNAAIGTPASRAPSQALDYLRRAREVKFHETLFDMLARQYEIAKQQESKNISMIEVLDPAIPPKAKSWPPRTFYTLIGGVAGLVLGTFFVLVRAFLATVLENPENRRKYHQLMRSGAAG